MAIDGKFPMWEQCLKANLKQCDRAIIRLENRRLVNKLPKNCEYFFAQRQRNKWDWREQLIQQLHKSKLEPEYFIFCDHDEIMPKIDFNFYGQMMFNYRMIGNGHEPYRYPYLAHAKAFKYENDLTYKPYFNMARIGRGGAVFPEVQTDLLVDHYCFYEKKWQFEKERSILARYPDYFRKYPKEYNCE
jgi:hypothetical protein